MLLFGGMFGDVGQGLVISLLGFLIFKKSGNMLGKIMIYLGGISTVFGFVYGSFFGDEHLIAKIMPYTPINPMERMMEMIGATIAVGVILIILVMLINIRNAYKQKDIGKMLFDRNGIAGLVFYLAVLGVIFAVVMKVVVHPIIIILFVIAPLVVIFMAHPLSNIINKRNHIFPDDKTGFFIEAVFELIETLLAFLSNTISFMRVGAFALNHAGFFLAFHMLSDMVSKSNNSIGGIIVMIFGNILIIALEGLIVGIQAMRLEYYELFSRFFEGEGTEFKPFTIKKIED
jgi:V/A-type H+-transporting ATPase subunit I